MAKRGTGSGGTKKLKMSNRKFRVLIIVPLVIVALVAVILTAVGSMMGSTLDTYLGSGETYVEVPDDRTDWDSTYYEVDVTSEGSES